MINPQKVTFTRGSDQKLYMQSEDGTREGPVRVNWAFPLTNPDSYVIVSNEQHEFIGLIKRYKRLDPDSLKIVEEELEESYFLPRITKIKHIEDQYRTMIWDVETDKGPRRFEVGSSQRDIRWLSDQHVVITDVDGNRYEIVDMDKLDHHSRELLEMEA